MIWVAGFNHRTLLAPSQAFSFGTDNGAARTYTAKRRLPVGHANQSIHDNAWPRPSTSSALLSMWSMGAVEQCCQAALAGRKSQFVP